MKIASKYLAACTEPKWPNQVGSLDFWWSVYGTSTLFFLGLGYVWEARWKRRWMTSIGKILVYYLHTWASKTWFRSQPSKSFLRRHTIGPNNQKHAQKLDSKTLWNWPMILIPANKFLIWNDCIDGKRKLCEFTKELAWKRMLNH